MEAVELNERPSLERRRLSGVYAAGGTDARRGSLIALEHPSIRAAFVEDEEEDEPSASPPPQDARGGGRRVSILPRQASTLSRVFALSTTSKSFQDEQIAPTKIIAMIYFDDPNPDVDSLRQTLADRLLDIPRFRCVVSDDGKDGVVFEPLARSDVEIEKHIAHVDGEGTFGEKEIGQLIDEAYLSPWDLSMPLWRMKIVSRLGDGRSLLFMAIDHAIGDGVGLLSVFLSLFDDSQEDPDEKKPALQKKARIPQGLSLSHRVVAILRGIWVGIAHTIVPPRGDPYNALRFPEGKLKEASPGKRFAQSRAFPLEEVKMMQSKLVGATVNDIIMALITMAISRFVSDAEGPDPACWKKKKVSASFPVNMRQQGSSGDKADLGNSIVIGSIRLPVDFNDPVDCIWRMKTRVDELKISPAFALNKKIGEKLLPLAPIKDLASQLVDMFNQSTCMISNVIGPSGAAHIDGNLIDDLHFTVAYPGSLYFGVLSFGGKLRISAILDKRIEGDPATLMQSVENVYDDLKATLEDVDKNEPLQRPSMKPRAAQVLEVCAMVSLIALPVIIALKLAA